MNKNIVAVLLVLIVLFGAVSSAEASPQAKAVKETVEFLMRKFTKEVTQEGVGVIRKRLEKLAVKYGDDALVAARKTGPSGIRAMEEAGEHGGAIARTLAKHGDRALAVALSPKSVALVSRYGDDAARAMIRHPRIAEPVIHTYGRPAAQAMSQLSSKEGIVLAKMAKNGELTRMGRSDEVLAVIGKYGDSAMNFIWRNKGALFIGTTLAAFLSNPESFLSTGGDITGEVVGNTMETVAQGVNWTPIFLILTFFICAVLSLVLYYRCPGLFYVSRRRAVPVHAASSQAAPSQVPSAQADPAHNASDAFSAESVSVIDVVPVTGGFTAPKGGDA